MKYLTLRQLPFPVVSLLTALLEYSGIVLDKVGEYLLYNKRCEGIRDVPDMEIPPELCLELLMAADFLDCEFFPSGLCCACTEEIVRSRVIDPPVCTDPPGALRGPLRGASW